MLIYANICITGRSQTDQGDTIGQLISDDSTENRQFGVNQAELLMLTVNSEQLTTDFIDQS